MCQRVHFLKRLEASKLQRFPKKEFCIVQAKGLDGADVPRESTRKKEVNKEIISYSGMHSIDEYVARVVALGGKILTQKTSVSGWEHLVICMDTANNIFNLWEKNLMSNDQFECVSISH
jgi:predicted enzyme related to lactoylglutathione lyase